MAEPRKSENEEDVAEHTLDVLSSTRYTCLSLARLDGGSVNFTFRGLLRTPVNGRGSVIVKHAAPHLARNVDFPLEVERSVSVPVLCTPIRVCLFVVDHVLTIVAIRAGYTARISRFAFGLWAWNQYPYACIV